MEDILSDASKFSLISNDDNLQNLTKFQRFLYRLQKRTALVKKIITACTPLQPVPHLLYWLPKTHKPGNPMRPIISAEGSFNHKAAKWLSNVLAPLRHHSEIVRDTFIFVKEIQNNDLRGCVMASFDVKSLFTNIPLKFTTNLISS